MHRSDTMDYICTDVGVDSSSRFSFRALTSEHMQLNAILTPLVQPAWVNEFLRA